MTNFESDLKQETILGKYLDAIYKTKKIDFIRTNDLDQQHRGVDLIIKNKSNSYYIDEKAQLHYLNKNLPTFTFELSYLKNKEKKEGWLFDDHKLTQYYFLITGIYLKDQKSKLTHFKDINRLKITSVNRKKLIDHLISVGLTKDKLNDYDSTLRSSHSYGTTNISELNPKSEGLIYYTEHLDERPINLQLRLKYLIDNELAKKFHYA